MNEENPPSEPLELFPPAAPVPELVPGDGGKIVVGSQIGTVGAHTVPEEYHAQEFVPPNSQALAEHEKLPLESSSTSQ